MGSVLQEFFHRGFHFGGNAIYAAWGKWWDGGGNLQGFTFLLGALRDERPSGTPSFAVRFYLPLCETNDLRWPHLSLFEER